MPDCCKVEVPRVLAVCPECGERGKSVGRETPQALLLPDARALLGPEAYRYCPNPRCTVVYFSDPGLPMFRKEDVRVRVGQKETQSPIPVCYCFGHTVESIQDEIRTTGRSTIAQSIRAEVKAGTCTCEITNPQGTCCLGDVRRAVSAATRHLDARVSGAVSRDES